MFTPPQTKLEASRLIDQLKHRSADLAGDRARELKGVRAHPQTGRGDAARVRDHETTGYGSTATWEGRER